MFRFSVGVSWIWETELDRYGLFHAATVEFDFKDFHWNCHSKFGWMLCPGGGIWKKQLPSFLGGAKMALEKALITVTDMKQPEIAWFARILQRPLQMILLRAVKWGMYLRFVVFILVLLRVSLGWTGDSRFGCQAMSAGDCNSSSSRDCNSSSSRDCNSGSSGDCNSDSSGSNEYHPADPWCWCFLALEVNRIRAWKASTNILL